MKAVILAGGKGTRFRPTTDTIPKALIPVGDITLLELILSTLPDSITEIIITTKYLGEKIQERIGNTYQNRIVHYAAQDPQQDGTWPAFFSTKQYFSNNELFCVLNCDDVFKKEELATCISSEKIGMGITRKVMPAKYHAVITKNDYIQGLERHPHSNREELVEDHFANGFFILGTDAFSFEPVSLIDGEFGLPQTILKQKDIYPLFAHNLTSWQPCNSFEDLEKLKNTI